MKLARAHFLKLLGAGLAGASAHRASAEEAAKPPGTLRLGIVTDCQYADIDTPEKSKRLYRLSPKKLQEAVDTFNGMDDLHAVCHLGDMIDRDVASYAKVMPIFASLKAPRYQLLGNHDYDVLAQEKINVPKLLGMEKPYYSFIKEGWRLIMMDGNEVSLFSHPKEDPATAAAKEIQKNAKGRKRVDFGGGLGPAQRQWLADELAAARKAGQRVVLLCHYVLLPLGPHSLWDADEVLEIIKPYADIAPIWLNGHNHDGSYIAKHGIHFLNLRGMVDTEKNTYARLELSPQEIKVIGFGREPNRTLKVPAPDAPLDPPEVTPGK
jgi:predicted phosphodiesterase